MDIICLISSENASHGLIPEQKMFRNWTELMLFLPGPVPVPVPVPSLKTAHTVSVLIELLYIDCRCTAVYKAEGGHTSRYIPFWLGQSLTSY